VQLEAGAALLMLAADTEAAYYRHVTALAGRALKRAIAEAGEVSADFAAALYAAGNINQLALDRERAAAASLGLGAVQADVEVATTRAALARLMGVGPDVDWQIATALPLPVATEDASGELQRVAGAGRLDLLAAQRAVAVLEDALGLTRSVRWLGELELGVEHERDPDGAHLLGPTLAFQIPLFNQGQGRVTRAAARLDAARALAQASALDVGHDVAQARAAVVAARDIVGRYQTRVLPLRERIVAGSRALQNYMLTGQFDVLQDRLALYAGYDAYLRALGDYWVARAGLSRAIGAPLPSAADTAASVDPAALIAVPAAPTPAHHAH
jgi:outer membrane protein, heavy metal efflux system